MITVGAYHLGVPLGAIFEGALLGAVVYSDDAKSRSISILPLKVV